MKRTVAAFIILLLLTAGSILHTRYLNHFTQDITRTIWESRQEYQQGQSETAKTLLLNAKTAWKNQQTYLQLFLNHDRVGSVNDSFLELLSSLEEASTSALPDYEKLFQLLTQLNQDEQLRLESIF